MQFLRWFDDLLRVLVVKPIGFGLWELRGDFVGLLDSGRKDLACQDWHGYKLGTQLLNPLIKY